jgi:hypothetical protein
MLQRTEIGHLFEVLMPGPEFDLTYTVMRTAIVFEKFHRFIITPPINRPLARSS